jgi:micrococcal nuclease
MRRTATAALLALAAVIVLGTVASCSSARRPSATTSPDGTNAAVVKVVDGDTIVVRVGGVEETVRLLGIDTPETKAPNEPVQCYGPEASAFTTRLLPKGTPVRLERDVEPRDQYGRLLAYVSLADGTSLNLELARQGYADALVIAPNIARAAAIRGAVAAAKRDRLGLWAVCAEFGAPAR